MRMLLPTPADDADPAVLYGGAARPAPGDRPWVLANMVASADGATAVDGVSGSLGGEADRALFPAIRAVADAILVAGGTVRAEGYGPATTPERHRAGRAARGQRPDPRLAIVSGSLDLDPTSRLFTASSADARPLVLTTTASDPTRREALAEVADVVEQHRDRVDVAEAVAELGRRGCAVVLCEGGPSLLGQLAEADLIDELCLTIAPVVAGGDAKRVTHGAPADLRAYDLAHVLAEDGVLFLRYLRRR